MPIWRLTPIDLTEPHWEASVYRAPVTVRADSEERARQIADLALSIAVSVRPGEGPRFSPWTHRFLVECRKVDDPAVVGEGPEAILDPADYDEDWRR